MSIAAGIRDWVDRNAGTIRAGIRATVAGILSYAVSAALGLHEPYWSVITSLLVIQSTVGASLQSSLDRVAGTIGGAIYGGLIGSLMPWYDLPSILIALTIALVPLTLLAAASSRYRIAPVTAVLALVLPRSTDTGALQFVLERIIEVALGGGVAVAVAFLVLPSRSRRLFAEAAANAFRTLADAVALVSGPRPDGLDDPRVVGVMTSLAKRFTALDGAATEVERERRIHLADGPDSAVLVYTTRRTRTDILLALRATATPFPEPAATTLAAPLARIAEETSAHLRALGVAVETKGPPPSDDALHAALADGQRQLIAVRASALQAGAPSELVERLFSLGYALDQLRDDLAQLVSDCAPYLKPPRPASGA